MYSYAMNDGVGENVKTGSVRTKINHWRAASRKILLTESFEKYNTSAAWDYGVPLARRHGTGISRGNGLPAPGQQKGINGSAVFLDGHAEGIDDDFSCNVFQIRPGVQ